MKFKIFIVTLLFSFISAQTVVDTVWVTVGDTTIYYLKEHENVIIPEYDKPIPGAAELYLKKIADDAFAKEKKRDQLIDYIMGLLTGYFIAKEIL